MKFTFEHFVIIMSSFFLILGWIFLLVGLFGIIMVAVSYPRNIFRDEVLSFMSVFVYGCMAVFGIILAKFHDRILIKPKPMYV